MTNLIDQGQHRVAPILKIPKAQQAPDAAMWQVAEGYFVICNKFADIHGVWVIVYVYKGSCANVGTDGNGNLDPATVVPIESEPSPLLRAVIASEVIVYDQRLKPRADQLRWDKNQKCYFAHVEESDWFVDTKRAARFADVVAQSSRLLELARSLGATQLQIEAAMYPPKDPKHE
jgi:hypothetical protein